MTEEERIESGCVVLRNIMNDLKRQYSVPDAIHASLVAARALAWLSARFGRRWCDDDDIGVCVCGMNESSSIQTKKIYSITPTPQTLHTQPPACGHCLLELATIPLERTRGNEGRPNGRRDTLRMLASTTVPDDTFSSSVISS